MMLRPWFDTLRKSTPVHLEGQREGDPFSGRTGGAVGSEPTTSRPPDKKLCGAIDNQHRVTSYDSSRCTPRCNELEAEPNADPLAAFVASLTLEQRRSLAALLTGQREGGAS